MTRPENMKLLEETMENVSGHWSGQRFFFWGVYDPKSIGNKSIK
jgi:hypothetical protein